MNEAFRAYGPPRVTLDRAVLFTESLKETVVLLRHGDGNAVQRRMLRVLAAKELRKVVAKRDHTKAAE